MKIGDLVVARVWDDNPDFWDSDGIMMSLARSGEVLKIVAKDSRTHYRVDYANPCAEVCYNIDWFTWRSIDLIPYKEEDPNFLFRRKKKL